MEPFHRWRYSDDGTHEDVLRSPPYGIGVIFRVLPRHVFMPFQTALAVSRSLRALRPARTFEPVRGSSWGGAEAGERLPVLPPPPRRPLESRSRELHPEPLAEPYVRLSPHTAPIVRTVTLPKASQWMNNRGCRVTIFVSQRWRRRGLRANLRYFRRAQ